MQGQEEVPSVAKALEVPEHAFVRCKSVCTLTQALCNVEALVHVMDIGVTALRIPMARFDQKQQTEVIQMVNEAKAQRPNHPFAVMLEVRGGELYVGSIANNVTVPLVQGQSVQLVNSEGVLGDPSTLTCAYEFLPRVVTLADKVYFNAGEVVCQVTEVISHGATLTAIEPGDVHEGDNISLPASPLNLPTLTPQDEADITEVAIKLGVEFLVLTQARTAAAVERVKTGLQTRNASIRLLVKLQNLSILEELEAVLEHCDGVIICGFELGLVVPRERTALMHEAIIAHANARGKPVLLLSDKLPSSSLPSLRIYNSVISTDVVIGVDGLIHPPYETLSQVTYHVNNFQTLCKSVESSDHYHHHITFARSHALNTGSAIETACLAAVQGAKAAKAKLMIVQQTPGMPLSHLFKFRPAIPVLVLSTEDSPLACLLQGCFIMKYEQDAESRCVEDSLELAKKRKLAGPGSRVLALSSGLQNSVGSVRVISL